MGLFASYKGDTRKDNDEDSAPLMGASDASESNAPQHLSNPFHNEDETTESLSSSSVMCCCARIPFLGKQFESYSNIGLMNLSSSKATLARRAFGVHWLLSVALLWNLIACLAILLDPNVMGRHAYGWTSHTLMAAAYLLDFIAGYYLWLRPMLTVLQTGSSVRYLWLVFSYSSHVIFLILMLVSFPSMSSTGIFTLLRVSNWVDAQDKPLTLQIIVCGISTGLFAISVIAALWVGFSVRSVHKGKATEGATQVKEQAKRQATKVAVDSMASSKFNMPA